MGTEATPAFELPPGTGQVFDQVCYSDEAFLQQTSTGGNLAMYSRKKKARLEAEKAEKAEKDEPPPTALALKAASGVGGVWSLSCVDVFLVKKSPNFQRLFGNKKPCF